jgi:SAM-dependent methyltransferase
LAAEDRAVLEGSILPAVRSLADGRDVLFVGVEWYTASYPSMFPNGNLVTIDVAPQLSRYGSSRHVTVDVRCLADHFPNGSFAAVVCNGVLGYGIDQPEDVARALDSIAASLASNGWLVLGWNDVDGRRIPGLDSAASASGLHATAGCGLPTHRTEPIGPFRHVYAVYRKVAKTHTQQPT